MFWNKVCLSLQKFPRNLGIFKIMTRSEVKLCVTRTGQGCGQLESTLNCVSPVPVKKCGQLGLTLIYTLKQIVTVTEIIFRVIYAWRFSLNSRLTVFMKFTLDDFQEIHPRSTTLSDNIYSKFHENTTKYLEADVSSPTDGRMDEVSE
jgi:hypothetical protein